MRILNAAQMREAERTSIEDIGLASIVLMENAGRQVVAAIEMALPATLDGRVAVLCGRGNNGGDGFVVARALVERGVEVAVFVLAPVSEVRGDARVNLDILGRMGLPVVEVADEQTWELHFSEIAQCTLLVDAIFGTGLRTGVTGMLQTVVADVNASGLPVVSVDLPSGLSADTPHLPGDAIDASMTVTFTAPKLPLILPPGETLAGDVVVAQIGITPDIVEAVEGPRIDLLSAEQMRALIPPRAAESHKGDYGRVSVVAGSRGRTGAAYLAAMGALRAGAGLVTVATPQSCQPILAAMAPEFMTEGLAESVDGVVSGDALARLLEMRHDVVACGPGLGLGPGAGDVVRGLLERGDAPLVLDADALTLLAGKATALRGREDRHVIITPHPGEMARLLGATVEAVQRDRLAAAGEFAVSRGLFVVLKGHRTLVATPEGRVFVNPTGGAGLATGGTGDVLTGMIAAWLAQLLDAEAACCLAVFLHGLAGELAEAEEGPAAMTATSVLDRIGPALTALLEPGRTDKD
jgi:NAD(P)H-hydrate epimerase